MRFEVGQMNIYICDRTFYSKRENNIKHFKDYVNMYKEFDIQERNHILYLFHRRYGGREMGAPRRHYRGNWLRDLPSCISNSLSIYSPESITQKWL